MLAVGNAQEVNSFTYFERLTVNGVDCHDSRGLSRFMANDVRMDVGPCVFRDHAVNDPYCVSSLLCELSAILETRQNVRSVAG